MKNTILILDLDGVLITTPIWKPDKIHSDGYSDFNEKCVNDLNILLNTKEFDIYLSSVRRNKKTLEEFNTIFKTRGISQPIKGYVPNYDKLSRREEIEKFIEENNITDFLVIDDDKSLNSIKEEYSDKVIMTDYFKGFDINLMN